MYTVRRCCNHRVSRRTHFNLKPQFLLWSNVSCAKICGMVLGLRPFAKPDAVTISGKIGCAKKKCEFNQKIFCLCCNLKCFWNLIVLHLVTIFKFHNSKYVIKHFKFWSSGEFNIKYYTFNGYWKIQFINGNRIIYYGFSLTKKKLLLRHLESFRITMKNLQWKQNKRETWPTSDKGSDSGWDTLDVSIIRDSFSVSCTGIVAATAAPLSMYSEHLSPFSTSRFTLSHTMTLWHLINGDSILPNLIISSTLVINMGVCAVDRSGAP